MKAVQNRKKKISKQATGRQVGGKKKDNGVSYPTNIRNQMSKLIKSQATIIYAIFIDEA